MKVIDIYVQTYCFNVLRLSSIGSKFNLLDLVSMLTTLRCILEKWKDKNKIYVICVIKTYNCIMSNVAHVFSVPRKLRVSVFSPRRSCI